MRYNQLRVLRVARAAETLCVRYPLVPAGTDGGLVRSGLFHYSDSETNSVRNHPHRHHRTHRSEAMRCELYPEPACYHSPARKAGLPIPIPRGALLLLFPLPAHKEFQGVASTIKRGNCAKRIQAMFLLCTGPERRAALRPLFHIRIDGRRCGAAVTCRAEAGPRRDRVSLSELLRVAVLFHCRVFISASSAVLRFLGPCLVCG